jgi:hypothetical protein
MKLAMFLRFKEDGACRIDIVLPVWLSLGSFVAHAGLAGWLAGGNTERCEQLLRR